MLRHFFTIAWRNLLKQKAYSAINVFGLATGMAVALLIGMWIWDELTFNHYHVNHDRIAQVMTNNTFNGVRTTGPEDSHPVGIELRNKWTNLFKTVVMCSWDETHIMAVGDKKITQTGVGVQPEFPGMLTLRMREGKRDVLGDISSILISTSTARALFGSEDPLGKILRMDNKTNLKVAGVFEDIPGNSTFNTIKFMYSWSQYVADNPWMKGTETFWGNHSWRVFVQLNPGVDVRKASNSIAGIVKAHLKDGDEDLVLFPMDDWHLYSDFKEGKQTGSGRIRFVWLFGIIGAFVLFLACINFMNLSTARSERRAKEVGIRKTLGSLRWQLIWQLLGESLFLAALALVLALVLVQAVLPFFNQVSGKSMVLPWDNAWFWILTIGFTVFTGLVSGSYPALYLSSFRPIKVLKGTFKAGRLAALPRRILVVVQFTVSVALITGTVIIYKQIQFAKDRPVGYTREGLVVFDINTPDIFGHYNALRDDLLRTGAVADMAESNNAPTVVGSHNIGFDWAGKDPNTQPQFANVAVTHDYGHTLGWRIKEGRDFSRQFTTDSTAYILNEAAAKLMGIPNPVGMTIKLNGTPHTVIGVVRDLVMESPYTPVQPSIFFIDYNWTGSIMVRIKPTMPIHEALEKIAPVFREHNPGAPFEYRFTDEEYALKFSDEERIGRLAGVFGALAILISCLGLFGLASFVAEQRTREMGVRKVLGASVYNIWRLLSTEFVVLVLLSCVIATPIAWYYLHQWLQQYEYRTGLPWWLFALSAACALLITLLTVSYQAMKAALANPVKSLRME